MKTTHYNLDHIITSCRSAGVLRLTPPVENPKQIVILHGLQSTKEHNLTTMYGLARAGFDTICIDLFLHGDRPEYALLDQKLESDYVGSIWSIINETAADVPKICAELSVDISQAGILGISAGGFAAHVLATKSAKFKAFVAAITSPDWVTINPSLTANIPGPLKAMLQAASPVSQAKSYLPTALLQIHGLADERVTPLGAKLLDERLQPLYAKAGLSNRLKLITYPELGHYFTDTMVDQAIDWFTTHLA